MRHKYAIAVRMLAMGLGILGLNHFAMGQSKLKLHILTSDQKPFTYGELLLSSNDSVRTFEIIRKAQHSLSIPKAGRFSLELNSPSYAKLHRELDLRQDTTLTLVLEPADIQLDEVVVTANTRPRATANGEIFRLSNKAKNSGDPFRALAEIPALQVDITNQSITTNDGSTLLVLIDGKLMNTGVAPIDPKFIESIELQEVVSAKYLQLGYRKLLNIKLRKDRPLYTFIDARTRHDIPLRNGFVGSNFELGRSKLAINGGLFYDYTHKDIVHSNTYEQQRQVIKQYQGDASNKAQGLEGNILLKWIPSSRDYLAAQAKIRKNKSKLESAYQGWYTDGTRTPFSNETKTQTLDGGFITGLYYEHTFADKSSLTGFLKYNRGYYDKLEDYSEKGVTQNLNDLIDLKTLRNQYSLALDYETGQKKYGSLALGHNLEYTGDDIRYNSNNTEVGLWSNYTHATYQGRSQNLLYMASLGIQHLSIKTEQLSHSYWKPRGSASLTWRINRNNNLRASYYLTNKLPESKQIVSYNLSTNPWYKIEGNPYLKPMSIHQIELTHTYNLRRLRLQAMLGRTIYTDIIESHIYDRGNVQVQSFRNNGSYIKNSAGVGANYRGNQVLASLSLNRNWEQFNDQDTKHSWGIMGSIRWDIGDFFIYTTLQWRNRSYTAISQTDYKNPSSAHIQIAWQASKQLYISLGLPYYWGIRQDKTSINTLNYQSVVTKQYRSSSLRPWLLVSWTIRHNSKLAIPNRAPSI